ncbi:MAG TPA: inner membrane CreD family protein [Polyangiales bacterium]|nr:inner membrane CreD family protein [Polyangiales bacterium]
MGGIKRVVGIAFIWCVASVGWMILGGVTLQRGSQQQASLRDGVEHLWGSAQVQDAPELGFSWQTERLVERLEEKNGVATQVREMQQETHTKALLPDSSQVDVDLRSDLRRKGLVWYPLYDVRFGARYSYTHTESQAGRLAVRFVFPDRSAIYDGFRFTVNGTDYAGALNAADGSITADLPVEQGTKLDIQLGYTSRGLEQWSYRPSTNVARLRDFTLNMRTRFREIDFPAQTLSPSSREQAPDGWALRWHFDQIVSGFGIGMIVPTRLQPGELASSLSFSAPISLFFYFLVLYVLATLRRIEIHPVNYFFIAGAFYAFHLLFAYSVDHLAVETAFALCSCVSVVLVASYLRLVVSASFALREAALAQLIYLVGFSLAYFWQGFTGLTVTVLAIVTLFALMQLTGRVRWSEVFGPSRAAAQG